MQYFINGVQVNVETGNTIKTTKDETLDSGNFIMQISATEDCYKPETPVKIIDDSGNVSNFIIINDMVSIASKEPLRWSHSITLAQNTRKFSKHQVRNTVFSQPAKPIVTCSEALMVVNRSSGTAITINTHDSGFTNQLQLLTKQKVKSGYFSFNLVRYTYTSDNKWAMADDKTSLFDITFNVLKDGASIGTYTYTSITSQSKIAYSNIALIVANSTYEIRITSITIYTASSDATFYDKYSIKASLTLETYFYTLYDILSILREQMALNEGATIIPVEIPIIEIKKEYVSASGGYQVSFRVKNNNTITSMITYNTAGSFVETGEISVLPNSYSDYISLGIGTSDETGVVYAYATNANGTSKTASQSWSIRDTIQEPLLQWFTDGSYGDYYTLTNVNTYAVKVYYKFYIQGSPTEYVSVDLEANGVFQFGGRYLNCNVDYSYYCVDSDGRTSDVITGTRVCGTIPTLTAPTITLNSVLKGTTTYTISVKIHNPNSVAVKVYSKSTNTGYVEGTISANGDLDVAKNELVTSGTNGYIIAYLTADNYLKSSETSYYWSYTEPTQAPTIEIKKEYVSSSASYSVYVRLTNNDTRTSSLSYVASGDLVASDSISSVASGANTGWLLLGTIASGNGTITGTCSNDGGSASDTATWSVSQVVLSPTISHTAYGSSSYQFTITTNQSGGATLYRTKQGSGSWSSYTTMSTTSTSFVISNDTSTDFVEYIEAYTTYNSLQSTTSTDSVTIPAGTPTLSAPTFGVVSNTTTSVTIRFGNPNSMEATYQGTITDNTGTVAIYGGFTIAGTSYVDATFTWGTYTSFVIKGQMTAVSGYSDSAFKSSPTISKPS